MDEIYYFKENKFHSHIYTVDTSSRPPLGLVIANGGAGQIGYIQCLAKHFLQSSNLNISIGWIASNTVGTLQNIADGIADIGIAYDAKREVDLIKSGKVKDFLFHCWMDRFLIVGPVSNRALLDSEDKVQTALLKIMKTPNCFWLSRCDNSTIHHRESEWIYLTVSALRSKYGLAQRSKDSLLKQLITEGDVFMAINMPSIARLSLVTAKQNLRGFSLQISEDQSSLGYPRFVAACRTGFLHRHCYMPLEATVLAEREGYYTLSDKGIFTSLTNNNNLRLYIDGSLNNQNDLFLNPADCLMAAESRFQNNAEDFLIWLQQEGKYLPAVFRGRSVNNEQCLFAVPYDQYQPRTKESWVEFLSSRKTLQDPAKYFTTL